jgi:hypothetical protein
MKLGALNQDFFSSALLPVNRHQAVFESELIHVVIVITLSSSLDLKKKSTQNTFAFVLMISAKHFFAQQM